MIDTPIPSPGDGSPPPSPGVFDAAMLCYAMAVLLRVAGFYATPWRIVLLPIWGPPVVAVGLGAGVGIALAIGWAIDTMNGARSKAARMRTTDADWDRWR